MRMRKRAQLSCKQSCGVGRCPDGVMNLHCGLGASTNAVCIFWAEARIGTIEKRLTLLEHGTSEATQRPRPLTARRLQQRQAGVSAQSVTPVYCRGGGADGDPRGQDPE
ncbi:unnamed protein product, partial [Prorocentrum cordatum]